MRLIDAKKQVLQLIKKDIHRSGVDIQIEDKSPDRDPGKFIIEGKPARVIAPFNGFNVNINLDWFKGSMDIPEISGGKFHWAVFALANKGNNEIIHYYICDYKQLRKFVLEFDAPAGSDHQDHNDWRGAIEVLQDKTGYFRWGDEPLKGSRPSRLIRINNIASASDNPDKKTIEYIEDEIQRSIENDTTIDSTEKKALVNARRGQGKYRQNLESIETKCRVSGVSDKRLLKASHIKPWGHCENNHERLDGNNGLLLSPNVDHLFDKGYITFSDDGTLIVSSIIDPDQLKRMGIPLEKSCSVGTFNESQKRYLLFHRDNMFWSNEKISRLSGI